MDTTKGKAIEKYVCEACKQKIAEETAKLSKLSLFSKCRIAKRLPGRFLNMLCPECKARVLKSMGVK